MSKATAAYRLLGLVGSVTLSAHLAFGQNAVSARPGTINYIEGQASLEGRQLTAKSAAHAELGKGQYLATANGKAELLLTPGVFLRLGSNSAVMMVLPDLTHTEVRITQGRAAVEIDQLYKQNDILIDLAGGQTQLLKNGIYEFDADAGTVRVFNGEAAAFRTLTPQPNERAIKIKQGKQYAFSSSDTSTTGFDRKRVEASDSLYSWSGLRSGYLGEANLNLARSYAGSPGFGYGSGFGSGWMWSPSIYSYTWLPGEGLFFSPFGYGFYSPYYIYGGGPVYGGYGYGGSGSGLVNGGRRPGGTPTAPRTTSAGSVSVPSSAASGGSHGSAGGGAAHGSAGHR